MTVAMARNRRGMGAMGRALACRYTCRLSRSCAVGAGGGALVMAGAIRVCSTPWQYCVRRFGPPLPQQPVGRFGACPILEPTKRPAFNTINSPRQLHFIGAVDSIFPLYLHSPSRPF